MMKHHTKNQPSPSALLDSAQPTHPSRAFLVASWVCVAALLGFIFYMSSKSGEALSTGSGIISALRNALIAAATEVFGHPVDVSPVGHFTEFFLLGLALANALRFHLPLKHAAIGALLFASAYGVTDELHQIFVAGRSCDPVDWLVDTIAAGIAAALFAFFIHLRQKRKHSDA